MGEVCESNIIYTYHRVTHSLTGQRCARKTRLDTCQMSIIVPHGVEKSRTPDIPHPSVPTASGSVLVIGQCEFLLGRLVKLADSMNSAKIIEELVQVGVKQLKLLLSGSGPVAVSAQTSKKKKQIPVTVYRCTTSCERGQG